jgi:glycosyltransferase involved in cell wall biosynthesis
MKKKVLFVIESLNLGGAEKSLVSLLHNLDYKNLDVSLMLFSRNGFFEKFCPAQVKIINGQTVKLSLWNRIRYKICRIFNFGKLHNAQLFWKIIHSQFIPYEENYDIAIAYNQGFATYYTAKFINAPKKYAWLNTDYKTAGYKIKYDYPLYTLFSGIVAVSNLAKQVIDNELMTIVRTLPVTVIPDIVDDSIVQQQADEPFDNPIGKAEITIASVGRLSVQKGFDLAIEACKILKQRRLNIKWIIVGEGQERENLERMISAFQLTDTVFLPGATPNPYPCMKACDIYVQTSRFEGMGMAVIEAAFLNKPIVTTNFPSALETVEHEKTGLICEMTPEAIANAVERLITDKELSQTLVNNLTKKDKSKNKTECLRKINALLDSEDAN